ncbi:hypothetical protein CAL7716_107710 (plasmid) [Calothrix sp. PCC 7716]|nr:hypothetical protein CAL7716_107710 [Calothrix sp. PCC 7716]
MDNDELSQKTLAELEIIAFATIDDFLVPGTFRLRSKQDIAPEKWTAIKKLNTTAKGFTLELHDKAKALGLIADYLGIFSEFNCAIATLRKYGLHVSRDGEGKWSISEDA